MIIAIIQWRKRYNTWGSYSEYLFLSINQYVSYSSYASVRPYSTHHHIYLCSIANLDYIFLIPILLITNIDNLEQSLRFRELTILNITIFEHNTLINVLPILKQLITTLPIHTIPIRIETHNWTFLIFVFYGVSRLLLLL